MFFSELPFEFCELVEILCCLNRCLEEGGLLVTAEGETLQHLIEPNLIFLVHFQQELAELVLEVMSLAEVVVTALFVSLEELL